MTQSLQQRENVQDVVVVGGGPSGSFAALSLVRAGATVTVCEEHGTIGVPSHCAGHLSIRSLKNLGLHGLSGDVIENTFSKANFYSPSGFGFSVHLSKPVTCAINREAFDRLIAKKAEAEGAIYRLNSRVQNLLIENGIVRGVKVKLRNGLEENLYSKLVVDAEGVSSRLLKQVGLSAHDPNKFVYAVEADVGNIRDVEPNAVDVFLGQRYAPGFYAWFIPRRDGTAKIGLATNSGNPRDFLQRLMSEHPVASKRLQGAIINRMAFHSIPLGGSISKTYSGGFMAVGDAASHVKPTTGGGVIFGLTCAQIAAQVAMEALQRKDVSSSFLEMYQQRCEKILDFDFKVMLTIRHFLNSLSDERIDGILRFCSKIGLAKTLEDIEEIDLQGQTLLKLLTKPSVLVIMIYFLLSYLSANP